MKHLITLTFISLLALSACSVPEPEVIVRETTYFPPINVVTAPRPVVTRSTNFYVVTPENYDTFQARYTNENGDLVFVAMSLNTYENLAFNITELRRYIRQQKAVIVYYENSIQAARIAAEEQNSQPE